MEPTTISPENLAKRWDIDTSTVYKYVNSGILRRVEKIGAVRILLSDVEELENNPQRKIKTANERRLEKRIEELEQENAYLREIGLNLLSESARLASVIR